MKDIISRSWPQSLRFCAISFAAAFVFSFGGCGYFEFDGAGTITGYDEDGPKDVTLPSTIDGIKVTAIGRNTFSVNISDEIINMIHCFYSFE
jgi:hypothetical protein